MTKENPGATKHSTGINLMEKTVKTPEPKQSYPKANTRKLAARRASTVKPHRTTWLLDAWIPDAALTLIAGREGIGKSTIAADFAAQATLGIFNSPMRVLYISIEDSRSIVTVPRLLAADADLDSVDFLDVTNADLPGALELPRDMAALSHLIQLEGYGLVVIDPITAVLSPQLNPNHAGDVRQLLDPLAALAERSKVAIIGVTHFGKVATADTGRAVLGSSAWSQVPRSVLAVAADDTNGGVLITNTKSNLAARTITRPARLEDCLVPIPNGTPARAPRVIWGAITNRDARDLLDVDNSPDTRATRRGVDAWLREQLANGARWSSEIKADAMGAGWSMNQVRAAKTRLGVQAKKQGTGGWAWHLPGTPPTPAPENAIKKDTAA